MPILCSTHSFFFLKTHLIQIAEASSENLPCTKGNVQWESVLYQPSSHSCKCPVCIKFPHCWVPLLWCSYTFLCSFFNTFFFGVVSLTAPLTVRPSSSTILMMNLDTSSAKILYIPVSVTFVDQMMPFKMDILTNLAALLSFKIYMYCQQGIPTLWGVHAKS